MLSTQSENQSLRDENSELKKHNIALSLQVQKIERIGTEHIQCLHSVISDFEMFCEKRLKDDKEFSKFRESCIEKIRAGA